MYQNARQADRPFTKFSRRLFLFGFMAEGMHLAAQNHWDPFDLVRTALSQVSAIAPDQQASLPARTEIIDDEPKKPAKPAAVADSFATLGAFSLSASHLGTKYDPADDSKPHRQFAYYLHQRTRINDCITAAMKQQDDGSRRLADWNSMLWTVREMHDPLAKAEAVFQWMQKTIVYDYAKAALASRDGERPDWYRSPQDTLRLGMGVCVDQALLLLESLYRVGIDPKSLKLEAMNVAGTDKGHAVVGLHIGKKKYVIDCTDVVGIWNEKIYFWPGGFGQNKMVPFMAASLDRTNDFNGEYTDPGTPNPADCSQIHAMLSPADRQKYDKVVADAETVPHVSGTSARVLPFPPPARSQLQGIAA